MKSEKILLLDVHVEGMEKRLKELEWNVKTVTKLFGPTEKIKGFQGCFSSYSSSW